MGVLLLMLLSLVGCGQVFAAQVIETNYGDVTGVQEVINIDGEDKVLTKFLGIPFAKPPVGELRFEYAQDPDPWEGTLNATEYPPQCIQLDESLQRLYLTIDVEQQDSLDELAKIYGRSYPSEDCLYLNVFVPREDIADSDSLSVLVWIHDGGLVFSSANVNEGALLALEGDIIVVSINYRLTGLGFLTIANATDTLRANIGLRDQVTALRWIKENIAGFGGNPDDVTLYGNSAGGISVGGHMFSPMTRGLFHRVISSSGSPNHIPWAQSSVHRAMSEGFIKATGCYNQDASLTLACLKMLPVSVFSGLSSGVLLYPVVDGAYMPADPEYLLKTGQIHDVKEAIFGGNEGEGTLVLNNLVAYQYMDESIFHQMLQPFASLYSRQDSEKIASLWWYEYTPQTKNFASFQEAYNTIHRDMMMATATRNIQYLKNAGATVYQYHYTHRSSDSKWPENIAAAHSSDIKFILPRLDTLGTETAEEAIMAKSMRRAWSNFAKTGNPNPVTDDPNLVWLPYESDTKHYLEINANITPANAKQSLRSREMVFWNDVVYKLADKPWESGESEQCPVGPDEEDDKNPQVETAYGTVMGKQREEDGEKWEEFLGIPYAAPPIGSLRWKKPQPPTAWSGVLNATEYGPACPQSSSKHYFFKVRGGESEDCLSLNIFVPSGVKYVRYMSLPVMVYIPGDRFTEGSGSLHPGQYLAMHGSVIVVTINYRLGALGWMTTFDQECPGNFGLWDQNQALKWVKQNIEQFGGDPANINLFGSSHGGISASTHILSPHSEDLISGVMAQSGTAYSTYTFLDESSLLTLSHNVGRHFNCPTNSSSLMLNCLRKVNASDLADADVNNGPGWQKPFWSPVLDGDFFPVNITDNDVFVLTKSPSIRLLTGYMNHETGVSAGPWFPTVSELEANIDVKASRYFRNSEAVAAATKYVYITEPVKTDDSARELAGVEMATDMNFRGPAVRFARDYSRVGGEVYLYVLRHSLSSSNSPDHVEGAHLEDLYFLFAHHDEKNMTDEEIRISLEMMTYWSNFAHSGNPNKPVEVTPEWPKFTEESGLHVEISAQTTVRTTFDRPQQLEFWTEVVPTMEGSSSCQIVDRGNGENGNNNGGNGNGDNGSNGGDGDDDDDDDCDEDELKLGIIVSACLAGGSCLLSLILVCFMCNIRHKMLGRPFLAGVDNRAAQF